MTPARAAALAVVAAGLVAGCGGGPSPYTADPSVYRLGRVDAPTAASLFAPEADAVSRLVPQLTALAAVTAADPTPARSARLLKLHRTLSDHGDRVAAIDAPYGVQHDLNEYVDAIVHVSDDARDLAVAAADGTDTGTPRARLSDDVREVAPDAAAVRTELGLPPS